jgi:hypothetical protein
VSPRGYDLGVPGRRVAVALWGSMLAMPVLFLGVVLSLEGPSRAVAAAPADVLLVLAVATSALGILLSRVVPSRIPSRQGAGRPEITALLRLVVGWSICEGITIFPLVAFLVSRDDRLLAIFFLDLFALALCFPTRGRWRAALPTPPPRKVVH